MQKTLEKEVVAWSSGWQRPVTRPESFFLTSIAEDRRHRAAVTRPVPPATLHIHRTVHPPTLHVSTASCWPAVGRQPLNMVSTLPKSTVYMWSLYGTDHCAQTRQLNSESDHPRVPADLLRPCGHAYLQGRGISSSSTVQQKECSLNLQDHHRSCVETNNVKPFLVPKLVTIIMYKIHACPPNLGKPTEEHRFWFLATDTEVMH